MTPSPSASATHEAFIASLSISDPVNATPSCVNPCARASMTSSPAARSGIAKSRSCEKRPSSPKTNLRSDVPPLNVISSIKPCSRSQSRKCSCASSRYASSRARPRYAAFKRWSEAGRITQYPPHRCCRRPPTWSCNSSACWIAVQSRSDRPAVAPRAHWQHHPRRMHVRCIPIAP